MNDIPAISVVMSVYNGAAWLRESIESILSQTLADFELIIVDDASTDGSKQILEDYAARDPRLRLLYHQTNQGLTRSLNEALAQARGELIARQDADDVSLPSRLEIQHDYLNAHPDIALVGSTFFVVDDAGNQVAHWQPPLAPDHIRWSLCFTNCFCHASVMFRRSLIENAPAPYDESLRYSQDFDLWGRFAQSAALANLEQPLVRYRLHAEQIGKTKKAEQEELAVRIARRNMERLLGRAIFSESEISRLRPWLRGDVMDFQKSDLSLLAAYLRAVDDWQPRIGMSPETCLRLKTDIMRRLFVRLRPGLLASPRFYSLCAALLHGNAPGMTREFFRSVARRLP